MSALSFGFGFGLSKPNTLTKGGGVFQLTLNGQRLTLNNQPITLRQAA